MKAYIKYVEPPTDDGNDEMRRRRRSGGSPDACSPWTMPRSSTGSPCGRRATSTTSHRQVTLTLHTTRTRSPCQISTRTHQLRPASAVRRPSPRRRTSAPSPHAIAGQGAGRGGRRRGAGQPGRRGALGPRCGVGTGAAAAAGAVPADRPEGVSRKGLAGDRAGRIFVQPGARSRRRGRLGSGQAGTLTRDALAPRLDAATSRLFRPRHPVPYPGSSLAHCRCATAGFCSPSFERVYEGLLILKSDLSIVKCTTLANSPPP